MVGEGINVHFPNGKSVPLSSINKPHSRIPGHTVPQDPADNEEFFKKKEQEREQRLKQLAEEQKNDEEKTEKEEKDEKDEDDDYDGAFKGMKPEDVMVVFPNGKKVPWVSINKPHAVTHPMNRKLDDSAGGLLHNGGHRPESE